MNTLHKSGRNRMVAGVLAGLAEYMHADPSIVRLSYVLLTLITGVFPGILLYIIGYFTIPDQPRDLPLLKNATGTFEGDPARTVTIQTIGGEPSAIDNDSVKINLESTPDLTKEQIIPSKDLFRVAHEEIGDRAEKIIFTPEDLHIPTIVTADTTMVGEEGELKKPNWPTLIDIKNKENEPIVEPEPETTAFEDLFDDDNSLGLDDLIDG